MNEETCISSVGLFDRHSQADAFGKKHGLTITFSPWHPVPEYRVFETGSLLSRNEDYPSGLCVIDEAGIPHTYSALEVGK